MATDSGNNKLLLMEEQLLISTASAPRDRKLIAERRRFILNVVNAEGRVRVSELAARLAVSEVTVRNDLKVLSEEGQISRTHGGAVRLGPAVLDISLFEKEKQHPVEKAAIAAAAAELVQDGMSIILDSGSTTTQIARAMKQKNDLTVITNALNIALELRETVGIQVILLGGRLRRESSSVVGHLTQIALNSLTADLFFLGVDGVDPRIGFTTPNMAEANVNHRMMEVARKVVVVTDPSKFGRNSLAVICGPDEVDMIITNSTIPLEHLREFASLGIEMKLV